MEELTKLLFGICALFIGIPVGNLLAHYTKEELHQGKKWFKRITIFSLFGMFAGLILFNDILLFSFAFIAVVTSRSLEYSSKAKKFADL